MGGMAAATRLARMKSPNGSILDRSGFVGATFVTTFVAEFVAAFVAEFVAATRKRRAYGRHDEDGAPPPGRKARNARSLRRRVGSPAPFIRSEPLLATTCQLATPERERQASPCARPLALSPRRSRAATLGTPRRRRTRLAVPVRSADPRQDGRSRRTLFGSGRREATRATRSPFPPTERRRPSSTPVQERKATRRSDASFSAC